MLLMLCMAVMLLVTGRQLFTDMVLMLSPGRLLFILQKQSGSKKPDRDLPDVPGGFYGVADIAPKQASTLTRLLKTPSI